MAGLDAGGAQQDLELAAEGTVPSSSTRSGMRRRRNMHRVARLPGTFPAALTGPSWASGKGLFRCWLIDCASGGVTAS